MTQKRILLVDDEPDLAQLLAYDLKKRGYAVILARDGEEGLAKAQAEKPDLIIFDIKMPKIDGYTFVKTLRKASALAGTPLIALTSYDMKDMFEIEGVKDYFLKAPKMDGLFEALARHLGTGGGTAA
ncbi:MAG: response regulator [Candidatus Omnitrophica bacterium]|nr:response regulator [Candidatus Omnitrophota bacterium]